MTAMKKINVIGAGLAGCEAAYIASRLGVAVDLYEMKPKKYSPAHTSPLFSELVCSNSFRARSISNAVGLLKEELATLGSIVMESAYKNEVSAGGALAVDRNRFSGYITEKIKASPLINVIEEEITSIDPSKITVVATGPLTSDALAEHITSMLGISSLSFYDAAAPIVDAESINRNIAFAASRYGKGDPCYLNCPMDKEQYLAFYNALVNAKVAELHEFDAELQKDIKVFEGCMPVEVMAKRGVDTLTFGPLKPVGLPLPSTGKEAYAVVQLRMENSEGTMYNMVGFQTHLTFEEQRRVFRMIPGLENAVFLRYGVMHRNTFLNSPELLDETYRLKKSPNIFFAGQMTGVEGYIESSSSGFVAGLNAALLALEMAPVVFPRETAIGALSHYISTPTSNFQPMNVNFGIISPLGYKVKGGKEARNSSLAQRALDIVSDIYSGQIVPHLT